MGCSSSSTSAYYSPSNNVLRAMLLIQKWYRNFRGQIKAREDYALTIFQSIEQADEQGQIQVCNFFCFMLQNYAKIQEEDPAIASRIFANSLQNNQDIEEYMGLIEIPVSYDGPRLRFPLTFADIHFLISAFREEKILHAYYVLKVLFESKKVLKRMPNFSVIRTFPCRNLTVCGDLHGQLEDLLLIFHKVTLLKKTVYFHMQVLGFFSNGYPSEKNHYVFNGDFVDRGKNSIEVLMILLVCFLVYPKEFHLNRGNHEDFMMNIRYGFLKEILHKYKIHGRKILQSVEEIYTWLPIGTIIDDEILVVHGGIAEITNLNFIHEIPRHKMRSMLMPPVSNRECVSNLKRNISDEISEIPETSEHSPSEELTKKEWGQIVDIMWSDPRENVGCYPNTSQGGGCSFGPDITAKILNQYRLKMLIRSHECKSEGYEICHDGKVLTVFSASNYYAEGSNKGAYVRLSYNRKPCIFQFQASERLYMHRPLERMSALEHNAFRSFKETMISRKTDLVHAFQLQDHSRSGKISLAHWAFSMESVLGLNLPWRSMSSHLVKSDTDGNIDYMSSFCDIFIEKPVEETTSAIVETLYRYQFDLKVIFNFIDTDNSGHISMEEFRAMWKLFSFHYNVQVDDSQINELANAMDLNKDGNIYFNEFLKAFYVVHQYKNTLDVTLS